MSDEQAKEEHKPVYFIPQNAQEHSNYENIRNDYINQCFSLDELSQIYSTPIERVKEYLKDLIEDREETLKELESIGEQIESNQESIGRNMANIGENIGQNGGERTEPAKKSGSDPLRESLIQEFESIGLTTKIIAHRMKEIIFESNSPTVIRAMECYLRIMGIYQGPEKGVRVAKFAQIINLPQRPNT